MARSANDDPAGGSLPVLDYGRDAGWLRRLWRQVRKTLPYVAAVLVTGALVYWACTYPIPRYRFLRLQREAIAEQSLPETTIVYEEAFLTSPSVKGKPGYEETLPSLLGLGVSRRNVALTDLCALARAHRWPHHPTYQYPPKPGLDNVLLAERRTPEGVPCVVLVSIHRQFLWTGAVGRGPGQPLEDDWYLRVAVFRPATFFGDATELCDQLVPVEGLSLRRDFGVQYQPAPYDFDPDWHRGSNPLTLYAGQVEADASEFRIPFVLKGRPGVIRGRLLPGGTDAKLVATLGP